MVDLDYAIQHHPARADLIPPLLEAIGGRPEHVVTDPYPDAPGDWPTARLAWLSYHPEATHHMVMEDDIIPCRDLLAGVAEAVAHRPERAICLYANKKEIEDAREKGWSWVYCRGTYYNNQAVVLPTGWIDAFVSHGDEEALFPDPIGIDTRLRSFLGIIGERVLYTVPSLVEHGQPGGSLLWKDQPMLRKRTARWWIGPEASPLDIDWTKGEGA